MSENLIGNVNPLNVDARIKKATKGLSDRIDNLVLNSGDSPAEVTDAHLDANGKVYNTLKERLDTENSELKSDLINEVSERNNAISNAVNNEKQRAISEEQRIESLFTLPTQEAVNTWLNEHPEATTTVQDGSLSDVKFSASGLLAHIPVVATVTELQTAITDGRKTITL